MTIEILEAKITYGAEGQVTGRFADIIITNNGTSYLWSVGGLPLEGDLQAILNAHEAELWQAASAAGRTVDLYELALKRVLKAFALVVLDEINILRNRAGLAPRTAGQIDDAIKAKLKSFP